MVLVDGIATAALVPLQSEPNLQRILVWMMVGVTSAITLVVIFVVVWFTVKSPGLLFNPQDIDPNVHSDLYGPSAPPEPIAIAGVTFEVEQEIAEE